MAAVSARRSRRRETGGEFSRLQIKNWYLQKFWMSQLMERWSNFQYAIPDAKAKPFELSAD
jgi:hypothetical protein